MTERTLFLNGTIAEESWFDDDVTPQLFKDELNAGDGDIVVWINSPGGDCVAAAQIYNMLMDYKGNVTVKIDGIAASAASVIAMAGTKVLVSPVSMMMIHNPATMAIGDHAEMQKAIDMLDEVKESIINKSGIAKHYYIESAATSAEELGNDMYPPAKRKLTREGVPFTRREARQMAGSDYDRFDYIIGMDEYNRRNIQRICSGDPAGKIFLLLDFSSRPRSVSDPWYTDDFDTAYNDILEGCEALLRHIEAKRGNGN